jgi:DNA-binding transcriptional LysR family regulator
MTRRFELRHLDAFLAVCETLHFGQAAKRLHMSQPALSRAIQHLESALEVGLFERHSRNVTLTDAGAVLREQANGLVRHVADAQQRVQLAAQGRAGHLSVAYIDFALMGVLPEALQRFRQANPLVDIQLLRMATDIQREVIQSGGVDVGFLLGKVSAPGVHSVMVEEQDFVALVPSRHRLAASKAITIEALLREPLVLGSLPEYSAFRRKVIGEATSLGIKLRIIQEASTSDGIIALVAAGVGVSIYAKGRSQLVRSGVAVKPVAGGSSDVDLYMAWNASRLSSVAARFIEGLTATKRGPGGDTAPARARTSLVAAGS